MADSAGHAHARRHLRPSARPRLEMDDEQFADWTRLLAHRAGLFIAPERRSFLISGVRARMRETDCVTTREYYERVINSNAGETEWALLIDRLTVHETCFFRHRSSMTLVGEQLVPEALEHGREYTVWSVGCASGEETYSLAMLIDTCRTAGGEAPGFRLTGTDISLPALQQAREGVYLQRRLRDIPVAMQYRYCRKTSGTHFQVVDELRRRVCFSRLNLRDLAASSMEELDLIYCQNLLIYYDRQSRVEMVDQLATFLRPGGVLVLGPGELLDWRNANMEKVRYPDTLAYRRTN
jgi:type IV pilus assembly protein PilK